MNDSLLLPRGRFVAAVRPFPYVHDCYSGKHLYRIMCQRVASGSLVVWGVVEGEGCLVSRWEVFDYGLRRYSRFSSLVLYG